MAALLWTHVQEAKREAREAKEAVGAHKVEVAKEYVTNARLEAVFRDVKESLSRIEDKLDGKADK